MKKEEFKNQESNSIIANTVILFILSIIIYACLFNN